MVFFFDGSEKVLFSILQLDKKSREKVKKVIFFILWSVKLKLLDINNNKLAIFNESQEIADESRISNKANLNEYRHFSTGRGDAPLPPFSPTQINGIEGYYSFSTLSNFSNEDNVSQWDDLSVNKNNLTQGTANAQPEYNASKNSLQFKRNSGASDLDHMDFTTGLTLSEFTLFFVVFYYFMESTSNKLCLISFD